MAGFPAPSSWPSVVATIIAVASRRSAMGACAPRSDAGRLERPQTSAIVAASVNSNAQMEGPGFYPLRI